MLDFLKRAPVGLRQTHRALDSLANAIERIDRQRDTHGVLPLFRPMLGDMRRELDVYQNMVSQGEDFRISARVFHSRLSSLAAEIKSAEIELEAKRGLISPRKSPLESLYGPLDKLRTAGKKLNGPETAFQRKLNELIRKSGVAPYSLAAVHHEDPSYIYKLMSGERRKPSRESARRLATALLECSDKISEEDANRLIRTAGFPSLKC